MPDAVFRFEAGPSRGPGGQNVNKVHSRMILTVVLEDLAEHLDRRVLDRLRCLATNRISQAGVLRIDCDEHRSQVANRAACRERFDALVERARVVPKRRRKTKVPRGMREKRLKNKKHRGQLKSMRREKFD